MNWLKSIGNIRDGLIVLVSTAYIFGFVTWGGISYINGLGSLPVLEAQYFTAGAPILIVFLCMFKFIIKLKSATLVNWPIWLERQSKKAQRTIFWILLASHFLGIVSVVYIVINTPESLYAHILLVCAVVLIILGSVLAPENSFAFYIKTIKGEKLSKYQRIYLILESKLNRVNKQYFVHAIPTVLSLALVYYYVIEIYLKLPQHFGGALPRLAVLDVNKNDFSTASLSILTCGRHSGYKESVIPTNELLVYFSGSQALVVKPTVMDSLYEVIPVLEIPRSSIRTLRWIK